MSVIVKGMKMPKTCMDCPFADGEYGWCDVDDNIAMCNDERPKDCPLIALPDKYGRLVDAGECAEYFWEHLDDNGMAAAMNAINDMPTIVEAEDSE